MTSELEVAMQGEEQIQGIYDTYFFPPKLIHHGCLPEDFDDDTEPQIRRTVLKIR